MTDIDQFESMFKAASKPAYHYEPVPIRSVVVITDLPEGEAEAFGEKVRGFLSVLDTGSPAQWRVLPRERTDTIGALLDLTVDEKPDLVITYRNLHSVAWKWPHSLGDHVDVLTQAAKPPVLLLPRPEIIADDPSLLQNTNRVMAMTDHLTGDSQLVTFAAMLTEPGGTLVLSHVEDRSVFERYLGIIGKLPSIDTDRARIDIEHQLLKEPQDYIESCQEALAGSELHLTVEAHTLLGHHLSEYTRLVEEHEVDLLVLNTKDDAQLAMHGTAYALAVELRRTPMLLL